MREYAQREPHGHERRVELRFLRSPVEILGEGEDGPVTGIRVVKNKIENGRAVPTGEEEVISCGLVLRSIGYRGVPLAGIPFDERRGLIRNDGGRVCAEDGATAVGEYAVGWIKRGPSGVIGTNKKDAADTVARIVEDAEAGRLLDPVQPDAADTAAWLLGSSAGAVEWAGWQAIDAHERSLGEPAGRPRVKLVRMAQLIEAGAAAAAPR
jgi:ferredoxin/flavodoxin---NADP+ reductase